MQGGVPSEEMTDRRRFITYLETLEGKRSPFLVQLEEDARKSGIPIIRRDTQRLMRTLLSLHQPGTILEIGTAVGFSSVFFCEYSSAKIVTIENYGKRIPVAKENIRLSGYEGRITLLEGDAELILPDLSGPFDMIFLDAAQGQYIRFLPQLRRLLRKGGLLITDNVLIGGDLLESHYAVPRRKRTIHRRMREYLRAITDEAEFDTAVLTTGDGLAVTVKK